ncbi:MAG: hypothetical protein V2J02_22455 [Pseudomonadales bacterium]|jgi:hypothetical protein|nr:hypothetical protein [Pseudomonadales bacterium]
MNAAKPAREGASFSVSPIRGLHLQVPHEGHDVTFHANLWNGREWVLVDGEPVSSERTFGLHTEHAFELDGAPWQLVFTQQHLLRGPWICTLRSPDRQTRTVTIHVARPDAGDLMRSFLRAFVVTLVLCLVMAPWIAVALTCIVMFVSAIANAKFRIEGDTEGGAAPAS